MSVLVDTNVFSDTLAPQHLVGRQASIGRLRGHHVFLAPQTVVELRFGALRARWGERRRLQLEEAIEPATVVTVTESLLDVVVRLRLVCELGGHPLAAKVHSSDLWIAACAVHLGIPLVTDDRIFDDVPGLAVA